MKKLICLLVLVPLCCLAGDYHTAICYVLRDKPQVGVWLTQLDKAPWELVVSGNATQLRVWDKEMTGMDAPTIAYLDTIKDTTNVTVWAEDTAKQQQAKLDTVDAVVKALALVMLDANNAVRIKAGMPTNTVDQLTAAIVQKMKTMK
ncbi:MAG: hypothetical protein C0404_13360 [Verrucomicrobia bacterium]|nr:hypothetical protein [Verrucomicrobiota bacterium]